MSEKSTDTTAQQGQPSGNGQPPDRPTLNDILGILWMDPFEHTAVCQKPVGGIFTSDVVLSTDAADTASKLPARADVWFSINPVKGPPRQRAGRGKATDVTRWAALYLDVDVKPGGFADLDAARAFVDEISALIGTRPSIIIYSGHGLQTIWPIDGGLLSTPKDWDRAYRLARRFGRLAARIADSRGATLDTVSDLSRVLRAPDTTNWKDPTTRSRRRRIATPADHSPSTRSRSSSTGTPALGNDEPITGAVESAPADWAYGQETCKYVVEMIKGWKTDHPKGGRHQWALDRCVRLAAAHRLGCITEKHLPVALDRLEAALKHWCATTEPRRELHHNEVRGDDHSAHPWAVAKVATFTDEQTKAELGGHKHRTQSSEEVIAKDHNLCLPEAFWERECLAQIRQWAWAHEVPADSVLNAALAELSASMPPQVRADTGIMRPLALHHLAGIAGPTGGGKTTMARVGRECLLISPPPSHGGQWNDGFGVRCPDGVDTVEDDRNTVPYRLPLGSGQGICEAYMGMEYGPVGANGKRGKPRRSPDPHQRPGVHRRGLRLRQGVPRPQEQRRRGHSGAVVRRRRRAGQRHRRGAAHRAGR